MRYRLRTLLIVLAVGPVVLAAAWPIAKDYWLLRTRGDFEVVRRIIDRHCGPGEHSDGPLFHPIAEFLWENLP